jgi:archaellum component FlaC
MENNTNKQQYYLYLTLSKVLSNSIPYGYISLTYSLFISDLSPAVSDININKLDSRKYYIIKIVKDLDINLYTVTEHNHGQILEFIISMEVFLNLHRSKNPDSINMLDIILNNIKNHPLLIPNGVQNIDLSRVLFIFEGIDIFSLKVLFKDFCKIILSNGAISSRSLVSTTDFALCRFLDSLGFNLNNIYSSTKILKIKTKKLLDLSYLNYSPKGLMLLELKKDSLIIFKKYEDEVKMLQDSINNAQTQIYLSEGRLTESQSILLTLKDTRKIKKNVLKRDSLINIISLNKQYIENYNNRLDSINNKIKELKSLFESLNESSDLDLIQDLYLKYCHIPFLDAYYKRFKNSFHESNSTIKNSPFLVGGKRDYSQVYTSLSGKKSTLVYPLKRGLSTSVGMINLENSDFFN